VPPGTVRYWSWLFAALDSREPLLGVYALLAEWRALMDPDTALAVAQIKLAWWHEEMRRLAEGAPVHPISRYLASQPRSKAADFVHLEKTVEAAAKHLAGAPLERGAQLEAHSGALRANPLIVAAQDRAEPDADIEPDDDIADHAGVGRDPEEALRRQRRPAAIERIDRHGAWPPRG